MSRQRTHGFRFSLVDACAIALCAFATWALWDLAGTFVWIFAVALGHFFLFCNIFRVRRSFELIWTALFFLNFSCWYFLDAFSWAGVLGVQSPVTLLAIVAEMGSPRYHGVLSRRVNPRLEEYLRGEEARPRQTES